VVQATSDNYEGSGQRRGGAMGWGWGGGGEAARWETPLEFRSLFNQQILKALDQVPTQTGIASTRARWVNPLLPSDAVRKQTLF